MAIRNNSIKYSYQKNYHVIALCFADFASETPMNIFKAIVNRCKTAGCKVIVYSTCSDLSFWDNSDIGEAKLFDAIHMECFDAVVVLGETFKNENTAKKIIARANEVGVPAICIDKKFEGSINIGFTYGDSFEKIVRHVVEEHHATRVNFIAGIEGNSFSEERLASYKKVLNDNHIPIEEQRIGYGDFWEGPAKRVLEDFLNSSLPLPEAIVCANDTMAIATCRKLKENGYRVPDDIIVTGFDGIDLEKYHTPRLSTAEYNMEGLVDTILTIVDNCCAGIEPQSEYKINYIFRKSASCGCLPIEIVDISDKIYQLAIEKKDNDYFNAQAYRMTSHLSNKGNLRSVFEEFEGYLRTNDSSYLWVCTNEDMLSVHFNFANYVHKYANKDTKPYEDIMNISIRKMHSKYYYGDKVRHIDIIPNLSEILEEENYLFIIPLHAEEIPLGYVASTFPIASMRVSPYHALMVNFMHVLNNFRTRDEKENFYSRDMLTDLYNRWGFYKNIKYPLECCIEEKKQLAVISIDMDGLKRINDYFGHKEGDFALHKIAEAMKQSISDNEYAARFGGDEFLIAFGSENASKRVKEVIDSIHIYLDTFNHTQVKDYQVEASFGTFIGTPGSVEELDEYIKRADDTMYLEKSMHKRTKIRK